MQEMEQESKGPVKAKDQSREKQQALNEIDKLNGSDLSVSTVPHTNDVKNHDSTLSRLQILGMKKDDNEFWYYVI